MQHDTDTELIDWESHIARMVETVLALALPAALSAPALQSGQQLAPPACQLGPGLSIDDDDTTQTAPRRFLHVSSACTEAAIVGRSPLLLPVRPSQGNPDVYEKQDRRHERQSDRRTVTVGRSRTVSSALPPASTTTTSVPAVGHEMCTNYGHTVNDGKPLQMMLPPLC